jgi:hypothetical protein
MEEVRKYHTPRRKQGMVGSVGIAGYHSSKQDDLLNFFRTNHILES